MEDPCRPWQPFWATRNEEYLFKGVGILNEGHSINTDTEVPWQPRSGSNKQSSQSGLKVL